MDKNLQELKDLIEQWSINRNLHIADSNRQFLKLVEETGELASAMARNQRELIVDSLGDIFVVLTILSQQQKIDLRDAVEAAYEEIKDRKGKMVDGVFIKEEDLKNLQK